MATFSQGFLNALTRPSYAQNLGMLGQQIGQLPAQAQQQKIMQQQKEKLAGFDPNTVEGLAGLATFYQGRGELDRAVEYATAARTLRDQLADKAKATTKEQKEEEARARQRLVAYQKAAREDDPATAVGRVRDMSLEQLMEYTTPEKPQDLVQLSSGARLIDPETRRVVVEPTYAPEKPTPPKIEVRLQGDDLVTFTDGKETGRTKPPEDSEKIKGARLTVANSAARQISVLEEAKQFILSKDKEAFSPMGSPTGFFGGVLSAVPGTDAYTLENKYYQQIKGAEARRGIQDMLQTAEQFGSRGTGLGQITQIEFKTLLSNLIGLTTGLSAEDQLDSLDKMIANYTSIQQLASGEELVDIIDFSKPEYVKAGYVKEGDTLYYYPQGPDGPERVYNRKTQEFE